MTRDEFIEKAKLKHVNKYNYDLVIYKNNKTKIIIRCDKHGEFRQTPNDHLHGAGCPKCAIEYKATLRNLKAANSFKNKAKSIHNDKYNYLNVNYIKADIKVIIECKKHGYFEQSPNKHLKGHGCRFCIYDNLFSSTDLFIENAKLIHGDKYNYSLVKYVGSKDKLIIICPNHKEFLQRPNDHLSGHGCPKCQISIGEFEICKILDKYEINYKQQKRYYNCKNIRQLPFDFYLLDHNICIEYDGEQHFKPVKFANYSTDKAMLLFETIKQNDNIKNKYCYDNNITLIRIPFYEKNIEDVVLKNINIPSYQ